VRKGADLGAAHTSTDSARRAVVKMQLSTTIAQNVGVKDGVGKVTSRNGRMFNVY